jgi:chromosome segregation ATPase
MSNSPTAHARSTLTALSQKLAAARSEETLFADRLSALEAELALSAARLDEMRAPDSAPTPPAAAHRRGVLNQRIANLLELRASLVAERAKRRRSIDEMAQRKDAIDAALEVLRQQTSSQPGAPG